VRSKRALYFFDAVILAFLFAALLIELTGGFYTEPFGIRVSARRPDRPLIVALVLGFVRWRWLSSAEFFGRPLDFYRRLWRRLFDPSGDAKPDTAEPKWHNAAALIGLTAIAAVMLQEQLRQMTSVPDLGDPLFSMWRMGWVYQQLIGDPRGFFDANIFHPTPLTLTLSDSMLLPSFVAAPLLLPVFILCSFTTDCSWLRSPSTGSRRTCSSEDSPVGRRQFHRRTFLHVSPVPSRALQPLRVADDDVDADDVDGDDASRRDASHPVCAAGRGACSGAAVFVDVLRRLFSVLCGRGDRLPRRRLEMAVAASHRARGHRRGLRARPGRSAGADRTSRRRR
jgi:hypothetical protein